ncbi:MAG: hypothetical protein H0X13_09770 [Ramlibacter sp.]|nr:hypothetical protein [Ramlibacter sp.]
MIADTTASMGAIYSAMLFAAIPIASIGCSRGFRKFAAKQFEGPLRLLPTDYRAGQELRDSSLRAYARAGLVPTSSVKRDFQTGWNSKDPS